MKAITGNVFLLIDLSFLPSKSLMVVRLVRCFSMLGGVCMVPGLTSIPPF